MRLPSATRLAIPSAMAAAVLGAFLWLGASPDLAGLVVEARPLGGARQGLALGLLLQRERFHQRFPVAGAELELTLDTLDAHRTERLILDADGHAALDFLFDLARARLHELRVIVEPVLVEGNRRTALPSGLLRLSPRAGEGEPAPSFDFAPVQTGGPRVLAADSSQWPPPVEHWFEVDWRATRSQKGGATGELAHNNVPPSIDAAPTLTASGEGGVRIERVACAMPGVQRTRVFIPSLTHTLDVSLIEPAIGTSAWRGAVSSAGNLAVEVRADGDDVVANVRSNVSEARFQASLVDGRGILTSAPLVVREGTDGFGVGSLSFPMAASSDAQWLVLRETAGGSVKVVAAVEHGGARGGLAGGAKGPNLEHWLAFDDFPAALRLARGRRRRAIACAVAVSALASAITLLGLRKERRGAGGDAPLSIDGTRPVTDPKRGWPLLILLAAALFATVVLAASLSNL